MIFDRSKRIRTRVAAIIIEDNKILLIAHKKKKNIYWLLPGGGVCYGESLEQALKRELNEELGIEINVNEIAFVFDSIDPSGARHIINICFYCSYHEGKYFLGEEGRLFDYGFFETDKLQKIQVFPPIQNELKNMMNRTGSERIYLGKKWTSQ